MDQPAGCADGAGAGTRPALRAPVGARIVLPRTEAELRKTDVLQSHTVETAAQGVAALVLVSALLAAERARAAAGHVPVLRVSFRKVLELVKPMWLTVQLGEGLLTDRQKDQMLKRAYGLMGRS